MKRIRKPKERLPSSLRRNKRAAKNDFLAAQENVVTSRESLIYAVEGGYGNLESSIDDFKETVNEVVHTARQ